MEYASSGAAPAHVLEVTHICEEPDEPPPIHRLVAAADCVLPATAGYVSVFDMAAMARHCGPLRLFGAKSTSVAKKPTTIQDRTLVDVTREPGIVRCKRLHHTETKEWQDKEAERRARQIVPKPPKQSFRMGKKAKASQEG